MSVLDEVHLLNITVSPAHQRQGWARMLLDALALWSRGKNAQWIWLEVRESNIAAQKAYLTCGFASEGIRPNYYEDNHENAVIMWLYKEGAGHE